VSETGPIHEQDFCAEIAKWAEDIFKSVPTSPFAKARIEGFGSGKQRRKRKDLRFYDKGDRVALTGEVKLPGTVEGRSPYDGGLIQDAHSKADNVGARYFFTWNVNNFVLWDRALWDRPLLERRVREWQTGRTFRNADEVGRPESLEYIRRNFLPGLLADIGDIYAGQRVDWGMPPDEIFIRQLESHLSWPVELTRESSLSNLTGREPSIVACRNGWRSKIGNSSDARPSYGAKLWNAPPGQSFTYWLTG
jgi:hypothetical protein